MVIRQFYESLGDFLYVISKVDGAIHEKEESALMNEIAEIIQEYPGFGKNAEVQNLLLTKLHYYNRGKKDESFTDSSELFLKFINLNKLHLTEISRTIALRLIRKVAEAYKGIGKTEKLLLQEVEAIFNSYPTQRAPQQPETISR